MVENAIQTKSGIMINVVASVKNTIYSYMWKRFGTLLGVVAMMVNLLVSIISDSVITCDEIIDAVKTKTVTTNFSEKKCNR